MTLTQATEARKNIERHIRDLQRSVEKATRYLNGEKVDLKCFRPFFDPKYDENGKELPPHKDWVKNVFIKKRLQNIVRDKKALRAAISKEREMQKKRNN